MPSGKPIPPLPGMKKKEEKKEEIDLEIFFLKHVATLINHGHSNVWEYGYSFFKICLDALKEEYKQMVIGMAAGIGLAFSGKKEDIKKFLEE